MNQTTKALVRSVLKSLGLYRQAAMLSDNLFPHRILTDRKKTLQFYSQFIQCSDLCFDVGANDGFKTKPFLMLGAKVVAIEPQAACLQRLHRIFDDNPNVSIVEKAVGDKEGVADFAVCQDRPSISTMSEKWVREGRFSKTHRWTKIKVPVTTLDALIGLFGVPSFCKIDVEGFEESVLKGLSQRIPYMCFEFSQEMFDETERCISHLLSLGPAEFNFSIGDTMEFALPTWLSANGLYAGLRSFEDELLQGDIYVRSWQGHAP